MDRKMTPALDSAITDALFAMNAACNLLQILCENFLDSQLWREGEAELSRQAAFCLMQDSASRYLSLTTVTLQLLDRARSQLDSAAV